MAQEVMLVIYLVGERNGIVGITRNQMDHDFDSFALAGHAECFVYVGQVEVM